MSLKGELDAVRADVMVALAFLDVDCRNRLEPADTIALAQGIGKESEVPS